MIMMRLLNGSWSIMGQSCIVWSPPSERRRSPDRMDNEEAHDAGRESESREPSTHCTGRCWGYDPLEICLRTVAPIKPSAASTSMCRCDRMDVQFSRGLDQLSDRDDDDDVLYCYCYLRIEG
jgi:hypothetical protein